LYNTKILERERKKKKKKKKKKDEKKKKEERKREKKKKKRINIIQHPQEIYFYIELVVLHYFLIYNMVLY